MTITEEIRDIVERVKNMGPEWRHTANVLTDAMGAAEHAQNARLRYLTTCIDEAKGRLAYHKQEIRTLPEQIAKLEAERERLESQTGLDLLRAVVTERPTSGELVYTAKPPGQVLVDGKPEDPFVPGLPPLRLREVWAEWEDKEGDVVTFTGGSYRYANWPPNEMLNTAPSLNWQGVSLRPHGKTRAEVEAMADARQKPALLDLRELPAGTVCEARDRIQIPYTAVSIRAGVLFTIEEHCKPPIAPGEDVRVRVASTTDTWAIPALVPARVVEEPKGESDG